MAQKDNPKLTITLTDRAPVAITKEAWPVIASAKGDSFDGNDYGRHQQAVNRGEVDLYRLTARQHTDGRAIVYGAFVAATAWTGHEDHRGGVLLSAGANIAAAIREVGEECGLPDSVIRECIADLPAEELEGRAWSIIVHADADGLWAEVPSMPGVATQGRVDGLASCLAAVAEAVEAARVE